MTRMESNENRPTHQTQCTDCLWQVIPKSFKLKHQRLSKSKQIRGKTMDLEWTCIRNAIKTSSCKQNQNKKSVKHILREVQNTLNHEDLQLTITINDSRKKQFFQHTERDTKINSKTYLGRTKNSTTKEPGHGESSAKEEK